MDLAAGRPNVARCAVLSSVTDRPGQRRSTMRRALAALLAVSACWISGACRRPTQISRVELSPEERRVSDGVDLYGRYCALCHGPEAKGYAADHAPSLVSSTFLGSASNSYLTRSIRNGRPGTAMGAYGRTAGGPLEESDIDSIIAYLRWPGQSWAVPPTGDVTGDATRGAAIFEETCKQCHGTREVHGDAVQLGNKELLAVANDAYLRYAITHGRPGTPMLSFSGVLSEQQIDDVVTFIRSWAVPETPKSGPPPEVPVDLPVVINPKGKAPTFTLREDRFVPAEEVKKALEAKERIVIIDARASSAWLQVHIPGSIPAPYYDMNRLDEVPKDGTWVIAYCACPHHASGAVVDELRKRGYPRTAILDEGILVWQQRGYPIDGTQSKVPPPAASGAVPVMPLPAGVLSLPPSVAAPGASGASPSRGPLTPFPPMSPAGPGANRVQVLRPTLPPR